MNFDLSFLKLELDAVKSGLVPAAMGDDPVFQAIAFHENALGRPRLDISAFRDHLRAAASGDKNCWGLTPLFWDYERMESLAHRLETEASEISRRIDSNIARFTSARVPEDLRCVLYVGTGDGGFQIGNDDAIYLNLGALPRDEALFQTLTHEGFHGREVSKEAAACLNEKMEQYGSSALVAVLYHVFEEGIASFIGYGGVLDTPYPVIRRRTPAEGAEDLKQRLWAYHNGELSEEDLRDTIIKTDCCYTAGVTMAASLWESCGQEGLDLWAVRYDWEAAYKAFRATPQGKDWPDLTF